MLALLKQHNIASPREKNPDEEPETEDIERCHALKETISPSSAYIIERKDEKNVLSILSKLNSEYSIFVSIFHSKWKGFPYWKISSLDSFSDSLIKEQDKLMRMGVLKTSKDQALLVSNSFKAQEKRKSKKKEPKAADSKPKQNQQAFEGASGSKKKKFENNLVLIVKRGTILKNIE